LKLVVALILSAAPAAAASRELSLGLEHLHFQTAETALNRDNVLGLEPGADRLRLAGAWKERRGAVRGTVRGVLERTFGFADDDTRATLREGYVQVGGPAVSLRVGKQRLAWGSGFAWNPTDRLEAPKNPLNTGLEQEGAWAVRGDWSPSTVASVTAVAARVEPRPGDLPVDVPSAAHAGAAVRLRLLVAASDVALVVSARDGGGPLAGVDLAHSLGGNVAGHVEAAVHHRSELPPEREAVFLRAAAGLLYTRGEQAFSLEYFHNGEGDDDDARTSWLAGLDVAYAAARDPRSPPAMRDAQRALYLAGITRPYHGLGLGRDYLQATWTRSRIGGAWGASLRAVASATDGGVALTPGVSYAPWGRLTLQTDGLLLLGSEKSEYRVSPVRGGVVTRARVVF
jgi:hypothetical protein